MSYYENQYSEIIDQYEAGALKLDDISKSNVDYYQRDLFLELIEKRKSKINETMNAPDSQLTDAQDNSFVQGKILLSELRKHVVNLDLTSQIHLITHANKVLKDDQTGTGPYTQIAREDSMAFLSQLTPTKQPKLVPIDEFEKYHVASQAEKERLKQKAIEIENNKGIVEKCTDFLSKKFGIQKKSSTSRYTR